MAALLLGLTALAVGAQPAPESGGDEPPVAAGFGTVLQGDRASALGLYLVPWQEAAASTVDRPPAHLDVPLAPLDAETFLMRVRVDAATRAWRQERLYH